MSKFAQSGKTPNVTAPIQTFGPTATYEGGAGFSRDAKSELFLLAVSNMVKENTFYESANSRDTRYVELIHQITVTDPEWIARLVPYLRDTMNMRSASLVMAAEYVKARHVGADGPPGRGVITRAIRRADEPAEMLAYWQQQYGRNIPQPVKRGVADSLQVLYNENNVLRYDGTGRAWRFADVIELVHPHPIAPWQSTLFKYLLDNRHHNEGTPPVSLRTLHADKFLRDLPAEVRRAHIGSEAWNVAGWSWERLAGWLPGGMDKNAWEAAIPNMGYMALLRNLRNFDQAGISDDVAVNVAAKLADPDEVLKSRQFPFRFVSAYKEIESLRWGHALEQALDYSLVNVPQLSGSTLILIDVSGSMRMGNVSARSKRTHSELAITFGMALAKRVEKPTVFAYDTREWNISPSGPLLNLINNVGQLGGGGTQTMQTLVHAYTGQDRVIILTDEQMHPSAVSSEYLSRIPLIYTFNLAGYAPAHLQSGEKGRYTFGGLTDAGFKLIPIIESQRNGGWPHMV